MTKNNISKKGVKYFFITTDIKTNIASMKIHSKIFLYNLFCNIITYNFINYNIYIKFEKKIDYHINYDSL